VDVAELQGLTKAREHRVFAGKLVRKQLSFPERAIVAALRVPEGDFRDWTEMRQWAVGIADALGAGSYPGRTGPAVTTWVDRPGRGPDDL
jgi:menaquinone-dependent protoporphyrinogen oxidase